MRKRKNGKALDVGGAFEIRNGAKAIERKCFGKEEWLGVMSRDCRKRYQAGLRAEDIRNKTGISALALVSHHPPEITSEGKADSPA